MGVPDVVPLNLNALQVNISGVYGCVKSSFIELPLNKLILDPVLLPIDKLLIVKLDEEVNKSWLFDNLVSTNED